MKHAPLFFASIMSLPVVLTSCIIFDEGKRCEVDVALPAPTRNPYTGECESVQYPGGYGDCDAYDGTDVATPPPTPTEPAPEPNPQPDEGGGADPGTPYRESPEPYPSWGACYSHCEALDEFSCTQTAGCQAAYLNDPDGPLDIQGPFFWGCWATSEGYAENEACGDLSAERCVVRDDCGPVYTRYYGAGAGDERTEPAYAAQEFSYCQAEAGATGCYGDQDCGAGYDCTADTECLSPPGCGGDQACPAVCYGRCVPNDVPPPLPGNCNGDVSCETEQPGCPPGTAAGVINGCWSGYCIPLSACESPDCGSLSTEASCTNASQCGPVYQGSDCTCDASGCTCQTLTYAYCQDA